MADKDNRSLRRGQRDYILDADSLPVYIGEGLGSLNFEEAIDLSIIKRTSLGLPADKNFIMAFVPLPERMSGTSRNSRASKNNPYVCPHCEYKATRYGNMVQHLTKIHGDYSTDPRHN
jgi:hypothetical protein